TTAQSKRAMKMRPTEREMYAKTAWISAMDAPPSPSTLSRVLGHLRETDEVGRSVLLAGELGAERDHVAASLAWGGSHWAGSLSSWLSRDRMRRSATARAAASEVATSSAPEAARSARTAGL